MGIYNERLNAASQSVSPSRTIVQAMARFLDDHRYSNRGNAYDLHSDIDGPVKLPVPIVEFLEVTETITDADYR